MKHVDDIMNAENWNRDLHNSQHNSEPALHNRTEGEAEVTLKQCRPFKGMPSPVPVSANKDRAPEKAFPDAVPTDAAADKAIPFEQPESPYHDVHGRTEYIPVSQPRPIKINSKATKKRISRRVSRRWPFILSGFLITLVSGILVFFWFVHSDSTEIMASKDNVSDEQIYSAYAASDDYDVNVQDVLDQDVPDTYENSGAWNSDTFDEASLSDPSADNDILDLHEAEEIAIREGDLAEVEEPIESSADDSVPFEKQVIQERERAELLDNPAKPVSKKAVPKREKIPPKSQHRAAPPAEKTASAKSQKVVSPSTKEERKADNIIAKAELHDDTAAAANTYESEDKAAEPFPVKTDQPSYTINKVTAAVPEPEADEPVITGPDSFSSHYFTKASSVHSMTSDLPEASANNPLQKETFATGDINALTDKQETHPPAPLYQTETKLSYQAAPVKGDRDFRARNRPASGLQPTLVVRKDSSGSKESEKTVQTTAVTDSSSESRSLNEYVPSGLSAALKEMFILYEDQFNDHSNNWPEFDNSKASALIEDGAYHIEQKTAAGGHMLLQPNGVASDMDYVIHISIRSVSSRGENSYGFVFGAENSKNNHSFQIRNGKFYVIEKVIGGRTAELAAGEIDNIFISNSSRRTLKLVKNQDRVRFYIDDFYIDEIRNAEFSGDKVGFIVKGPVKISVDWTKTQIRFQDKLG